jgi:hypothetical protein
VGIGSASDLATRLLLVGSRLLHGSGWCSPTRSLLPMIAYNTTSSCTVTAAIAAVASSAFMVIGVLLGWLFLKEKVDLVCWSGIGLVFSGVALFGARLFFDRLMAKVWSLTINDARLFFLNRLNR